MDSLKFVEIDIVVCFLVVLLLSYSGPFCVHFRKHVYVHEL